MPKNQIHVQAWREILARIFEGFTEQVNYSPAWLINPETNRPLKLNLFYPEIGVGIRLLGLRSRQQKSRLSLEEELQLKQREQARYDVCEAHGVSLANVDMNAEEPKSVFIELEMALSRANLRLKATDSRPPSQRETLSQQLSQARSRAATLKGKIRTHQALNPYYDLWLDREFQSNTPAAPAPTAPSLSLKPGMLVEHLHFGLGIVHSLSPSGQDSLVSIDFEDDTRRTFMLSLLGDKLILD